MPVITPPPRRNRFAVLLRWALLLCAVAGVVLFLAHRFGETPTEKAERLFTERRLVELKNYTQKQLSSGNANPLLMSYYVVAQFSTNAEADLDSLLSNLRALDERPIFRREALQRLLQVEQNRKRAGKILSAALALENPPGKEALALVQSVLDSDLALESAAVDFDRLAELFPARLRKVAAKRLQFRSGASTDAEVLRQLEPGEQLLLRRQGEIVLVSGKKGRWAFVLDRQLVSGWVFGAYLSPP